MAENTAPRINVRGVNFNNTTLGGTVDALLAGVREKKQTALYTPNSEIVQACIEDPALYDVINSAELVIPDGIGVVKAAKILGTDIVRIWCGGKNSEDFTEQEKNELFEEGRKAAKIAEAESSVKEKPKDFSHIKKTLSAGWKGIYEALDNEHKRAFWRSFVKEIQIDWGVSKKDIKDIIFF